MEWWQILLIGIASIVVGTFFGILIDNLLKRFAKRRETTQVFEAPVIEEPALEAPTTEAPVIEEPALEAPAESTLLKEFEGNLKIANEPWTGKLLPFQTGIWDTLQDKFNKVPANLQEDLAQIYIDIRLANSIVRLSTEFNHRSQHLDENYMKLRTNLTERLDKIKPLIEQLKE